jgi:dephospho-CoA kinase
VVDAALLVESGDYQGMDGVIVVSASETQQVDRLREREGLSEDAARKILASQTSVEERLRVADFVIRNEGSLEETRRRAKEVFQALKKMALGKGNLKGRRKVGAGEFKPRGQNVRKKRGGTIEE